MRAEADAKRARGLAALTDLKVERLVRCGQVSELRYPLARLPIRDLSVGRSDMK